VRQLLLDPAVNREFERLRGEAEEKAREVKHLQQELQAVNFSQDSKTGRMLMAKCRTLQVRTCPGAQGDVLSFCMQPLANGSRQEVARTGAQPCNGTAAV